jgi:hypothetical protein
MRNMIGQPAHGIGKEVVAGLSGAAVMTIPA